MPGLAKDTTNDTISTGYIMQIDKAGNLKPILLSSLLYGRKRFGLTCFGQPIASPVSFPASISAGLPVYEFEPCVATGFCTAHPDALVSINASGISNFANAFSIGTSSISGMGTDNGNLTDIFSVDGSGNSFIQGNTGVGTTPTNLTPLSVLSQASHFASFIATTPSGTSSTTGYTIMANVDYSNDPMVKALAVHNTFYTVANTPYDAFFVRGNGDIYTNGTFTTHDPISGNNLFVIDNAGDVNISASGNVGVGNNAPQAAVNIESSSSTIAGLIVKSNITAYSPGILSQVVNDLSKSYESQDLSTGTPIETFNVLGNGGAYFAGQVGINTLTPFYNLDVNGTIRANEVRVCFAPCDFVFDKNYKLMPLDTLKKYLKLNHHLPEIASAEKMEAEGNIELGRMNSRLLQKIEELTLYTIQQEEKTEKQQGEINKQAEEIKALESKLEILSKLVQK
jgi:hypothetical protein